MSNKYKDIMNLPHHVSKTRPQMPISNRAAQFSPFAALTGYEDAIDETARITDKRIEHDESSIAEIELKLHILDDAIGTRPMITVTSFKADDRKEGGVYVTTSGELRRIDEIEQVLIFANGEKISIPDILDIKCDLFAEINEDV